MESTMTSATLDTVIPIPERAYSPSTGVTAALSVSTALSVIACAFVFATACKWKKLRRHPASLILARTAADAVFCCQMLASHLFHVLGGNNSTPGEGGQVDDSCAAFSFMAQVTSLSAELYFLMLSVDLYLSITNPFTDHRWNTRYFHFVTLTVASAGAALLLSLKENGRQMYGRDNFLAVCWVRIYDEGGNLDVATWGFFLLPLAATYAAAILVLSYAANRLRQGLPETFEARLSMFRSSFRFVTAYVMYWLVALSVYAIISLVDNKAPPDSLALILAFALGSKGIVTCTVWMITFAKDLSCSRRQGLTLVSGATSARGKMDDATVDLRPHLAIALRREILYYTTLGISKSVKVAELNHGVTDHELGRHNIRFNRLELSRRKEELGLFDLERAKRRQRRQRVNTTLSSSINNSTGHNNNFSHNTNNNHHPTSPQALTSGAGAMCIEVNAPFLQSELDAVSLPEISRVGVSRSSTLPDIEINDLGQSLLAGGGGGGGGGAVHYTRSARGESTTTRVGVGEASARRGDKSGGTPTTASARRGDVQGKGVHQGSSGNQHPQQQQQHSAWSRCCCCCSRWSAQPTAEDLPKFQFVDYEPYLFKRVRQQNGIVDSQYVTALGHTRREKFGEGGGSGAFLYFSRDEQFIVKTLTAAEADVLLRMLHEYATYTATHPHALITRFYGLHAITMYGRTMHFAVMANVLTTGGMTLHERYDLKGSWVGRHRTPLERGMRVDCRYCGEKFKVGETDRKVIACPARPNQVHEPNTVLKDNDLVYKLRLTPTVAQALGDQIAADTEFLRRHEITDYSLLLGIHRTKYKLVNVREGATLHRADSSGALLGGHTAAIMQQPSTTHGLRVATPLDKSLSDASVDWGIGVTPADLLASPPAPSRFPRVAREVQRPPQTTSQPEVIVRMQAFTAGAPTPTTTAITHTRTHTPTGTLLGSGGEGEEGGVEGASVAAESLMRLVPADSPPAPSPPHIPDASSGEGNEYCDHHHHHDDNHDDGMHSAVADEEDVTGGVYRELDEELVRLVRPAQPRTHTHMRASSQQLTANGTLTVSSSLRPPAGGGVRHPPNLPLLSAPVSPHNTLARQTHNLAELMGRGEAGGDGAVVIGPISSPPNLVEAGAGASHQPGHNIDQNSGGGIGGIGGVGFGARRASAAASKTRLTRVPPSITHTTTHTQAEGRDGARGGYYRAEEDGGEVDDVAAPLPFFREYRGGLRATIVEGPGVYYCGIIDILQRYTWKKWAERMLKVHVLWQNGAGVSVMPPTAYAVRFRKRVIVQLIDGYQHKEYEWDNEFPSYR